MTSVRQLDSVRAIAAACSQGEVTSRDVMTDWRERLRAVHARTNCVATWDDSALDRAADLDRTYERSGPVGPLHGVPVTVKDWIDVADLPASGGWIEHRDRIAPRDATVVSRLRAAGAIVMAKTAVQVDSPVYGTVVHPHDPTRSPGASSSGEAAAVAGGGSPAGIGSDSGGSIRLPAAWSGAAGFKPTFGRVPTTGHFPEVGDRVDGRTQIGPITARVGDLIEILRVIAGPDGHDAGAVPIELGDPAAVPLPGLRIGWAGDEGSWRASETIRSSVAETVERLCSVGMQPVGEIPQHLDEAFDITMRYWQRSSLDGAAAERQLTDWDHFRGRALARWADVDLIVMPAAATTAPTHRAMHVHDYVFTLQASLTGSPAAVVPVGTAPVGDDAGLPVAVQVLAAPWADHVALRVACEIEAHATA